MKNKPLIVTLLLLTLLSLAVAACNPYIQPTVTEGELVQQIAGTRSAISTQTAIETIMARIATLEAEAVCEVCPTLAPPETPTPDPDEVEPILFDPLTMTITPIGEHTEAGCYKIEFLGDKTIPPETKVRPGRKFTKTWTVRNAGNCTWTTQFSLVNSGGYHFGVKSAVPLTQTIEPGQTTEISIDLIAPKTYGTYFSYWLLRSPYGNSFGFGEQQELALGVRINVVNE